MKCKGCGRTIEDNSLFCNWCGKSQIKKPKNVITVPTPKRLPSGKWRIQLRKEGISVTADTPERCIEKAKYERKHYQEIQEYLEAHPKPQIITLESALENYIDSRESTRAETTISRYRSIAKHRFQAYMKTDVNDLDTQQMVDDEIEAGKAAKTVKNSWALVASALRYAKVQFEPPLLPRVPKSERRWLDYKQIKRFEKAIKGSDYEIGALLALHGLRRSEIFGLRISDYDADKKLIHIRGAMHRINGENIRTELNKNDTSSRDVPILIDRLHDLLVAADKDQEYFVTGNINQLYTNINSACRFADLPETGVHGLRHSLASLGSHKHLQKQSVMAIGGWKSSKVLDEIYTHNADFEDDVKTLREYFVSK